MRVRYKHRLGGCPLLTLRRKRPAFPLLPGEAFHCDARKARFRVDEDDVEAAADGAVALPAAGGDEAGMIAQLEEFCLGNRLDAYADKMGKDVMVFLEDSDDLGVSAPPLPGLAIVVPVLTFVTAELPIFPSVGKRVAALQAVGGFVIQFVHHGQSFFCP